MTGSLSTASRQLEELIDSTSDWAAELLRRTADDMAGALDLAAMRDVESATEWRNPTADRRFQT
ncbi:hypothetical protein C8D77_101239 [Mesorhizobium loti]|uniref:Uncharacterized protein n=1 Tax=Rhizobium loti TaxID=381 RepID=A0A8E3B6V1_RHILI|nr:hypothetical protein [Mesorhizobium loti]PWJ93560.1 hypothetical protein C8D77_101239 [Mesorhizobium loti]